MCVVCVGNCYSVLHTLTATEQVAIAADRLSGSVGVQPPLVSYPQREIKCLLDTCALGKRGGFCCKLLSFYLLCV